MLISKACECRVDIFVLPIIGADCHTRACLKIKQHHLAKNSIQRARFVKKGQDVKEAF